MRKRMDKETSLSLSGIRVVMGRINLTAPLHSALLYCCSGLFELILGAAAGRRNVASDLGGGRPESVVAVALPLRFADASRDMQACDSVFGPILAKRSTFPGNAPEERKFSVLSGIRALVRICFSMSAIAGKFHRHVVTFYRFTDDAIVKCPRQFWIAALFSGRRRHAIIHNAFPLSVSALAVSG